MATLNCEVISLSVSPLVENVMFPGYKSISSQQNFLTL